LAGAVATILGWAILASVAVVVARTLWRRAAADGVLTPVLAGIGLRLGVLVIAHISSVSLGDHGLLFVDDRTHFEGAKTLAALWRDGQVPDPSTHDVLGTLQFGYPAFIALIFTLGTNSILLGKLSSVLLGGIVVYLVARISGAVLGERAKLRGAWLAALAPSLVWWSTTLMKEALATMLVALGVLAITKLPRPRALVWLGVALAALIVVRSAGLLALVVGGIVAVALAGRQVERRWLSRPLILVGTGLGVGVVAAVLVVSRGDVVGFYHQYATTAKTMFGLYQGSNPARVPYDVVKSLVTPLPWVFDSGTQNWDRALYPGEWLLLCALPLAALGVWRMRRRPEAWLLTTTLVTAVVANASTSGYVFRQRSMVEPLILVLALGGATSWRMAARVSAATLGVVAVVAGVQSRSPAVVAAIVGAGALLFLLSRWLPAKRFESPPDSPMVESFRESLGRAPEVPGPVRARVRAELAWMLSAARKVLTLGRARVVAAAAGLQPGQGLPVGSTARPWPGFGLRQWAAPALLLVAFVIVSLLVVPDMKSDASPRIATFELDAGQVVPGLRTHGTLTRDANGYLVDGYGTATVSFRTPAPAPRQGDRTVLMLWAGGGSAVSTEVTFVDAAGQRHLIARPGFWTGRRVDVTPFVSTGPGRLEFSATNARPQRRLFVDRVRGATFAPSALPTAGRLAVAAWVALAVLLVLALLRRARRHLVLVAASGLAAFLAWPAVLGAALDPLTTDVWGPAVHAHWLDLDHGLLSGTFGTASALAVQLFHAVTPFTGTGAAGARTASLLVGIGALAALYVLGRRLAGTVGAVAAVTLALVSDPFRAGLSSADNTLAVLLAATLFLLAVHRVLERADRRGMAILGAAAAVAILADPRWWPGLAAAVVLVGFRAAPRGAARAAIAVAAISFGLLALPARLSVANQGGGDAAADVTALATRARDIEFPQRTPEPPVSLATYVLRQHGPATLVRGTLSGSRKGLSAVGERPVTKLVGLLAYLAAVLGAVALLLTPRLRLLVIAPALVAILPWFFASRGAFPPLFGEIAFWPALFAGFAALARMAWDLARARWEAPRRATGLLQRAPAWTRQRAKQPS
jgi:hypothetical protein